MATLTFNEYQQQANETAVYPGHVGLQYTTLGLVGEAGEFANKLKKILRDKGGDIEGNKQDLIDELGDVLWYVAMISKELGIPMGTVAEGNIAKLAARKSKGTIHGSGDGR